MVLQQSRGESESLVMSAWDGNPPWGQKSRSRHFPCWSRLQRHLFVKPGVKSGFPMTNVMGEGSGERSLVQKTDLAIRRDVPISRWFRVASGNWAVSQGDNRRETEESSILMETHGLELSLQCQSGRLGRLVPPLLLERESCSLSLGDLWAQIP